MGDEFGSVLLTVSELRRLGCSDTDIVTIAYPDPDLRPVADRDPATGTVHLAIALPGHVCVVTLEGDRSAVEVRAMPGRGIKGLWRKALTLGRPIAGTVVARDSGTAWPSSYLEDGSRWSERDELDALSRVAGEMAAGMGRRPPSTSELLGTLLPAAARRVLLDTAMRDMAPDTVRLAALATRRLAPGRIDTDDLVALAASARVRHPGRVTEALALHPLLACLFARPWSAGNAHNEALDRIADGVPPLRVCRELLGDGDRGRPPMPAAAARSLSRVRLPAARKARGSVVRFHGRHPRHRALDGDEVRAVADAVSRLDVTITSRDLPVVESLSKGGRAHPLPDGYLDAHHDLVSAIASLCKLTGLSSAMWVCADTAAGASFAARRDQAGLVRIATEWHRSVQALAVRRARIVERARMRLAGPDVAGAAALPFPHLVPAGASFDGVTATPLLSQSDYLGEGDAMGHCVASQSDEALRARKCVLSLSSADGMRSTLSVDVDGRGVPFVAEHRGPGNADPMPAHARAVPAILAGIVARPGAMDAFLAARTERESWAMGTPVMPNLDDAERADILAVDFARIRPWLSRSEAATGPEAWLRSVHPDTRAGGGVAAPGPVDARGDVAISITARR